MSFLAVRSIPSQPGVKVIAAAMTAALPPATLWEVFISGLTLLGWWLLSRPMGQDKLPGIQLARAIAALSVCYFHSWTVLDRFPKGTAYPLPVIDTLGWVGVDLFFAISGFVIAMQVTKPDFKLGEFIVRRSARIYPLWWLALALFAALALLWREPRPSETLSLFVYSASLLPTEQFPFYDIGWSLQHEVLFYLAAGMIAPVLGVYGIVGFLALGSVAAPHLPTPFQNFVFYYPEFLSGIFAFLFLPYLRRVGPLLLLSAGAVSLYVFSAQWGGRPFFPVSLFLLIGGFATMPSAPVQLGNASYSIYLLHPLVFSVMKAATIPIVGVLWLQEPIRWFSISIVIVLSMACFRYFERPMMNIGSLVKSRKLSQA